MENNYVRVIKEVAGYMKTVHCESWNNANEAYKDWKNCVDTITNNRDMPHGIYYVIRFRWGDIMTMKEIKK